MSDGQQGRSGKAWRRAEARAGALEARKREFARDAIWDAAIDLFSEKGFEQTTVDDIARAAGTSRRSFFRYFESKSDLMAQPVIDWGASLKEVIGNCPAGWLPLDVAKRTALEVFRRSATEPRARKVMAIAEKYPEARAAQMGRIAQVQQDLAHVFARRMNVGARRNVTSEMLAWLTLSALSAAFRIWFDKGSPEIEPIVSEVFSTLAEIICGGKSRPVPHQVRA